MKASETKRANLSSRDDSILMLQKSLVDVILDGPEATNNPNALDGLEDAIQERLRALRPPKSSQEFAAFLDSLSPQEIEAERQRLEKIELAELEADLEHVRAKRFEAIRVERTDADLTAKALADFLSVCSPSYTGRLKKSFPPLTLKSTATQIKRFVEHDCGKKDITLGGRHSYFGCIRAFMNWSYSPASGLGLNPADNPILWYKGPKRDKKIMPSQDEQSIHLLMRAAGEQKDKLKAKRDKAFLALASDSGGRLSALFNIRQSDILWDRHLIKAVEKRKKEVYFTFGKVSEMLLKEWLAMFNPNGDSIWGFNSKYGLSSMLRRLEKKTGVKCNCHTFRRGFASFLSDQGVDLKHIKELGNWESLEMAEHYTKSRVFQHSLAHYKSPMDWLMDADNGPQKVANGSKKLGHQDSNLGSRIQSPLSYR